MGWTLGAALILVVLTVVTFIYLPDIENPPESGPNGLQASQTRFASIDQPPPPSGRPSLTIEVNGQQYLWRFDYPGDKPLYSYYEMVVPVDTTVVLKVSASDVIHSWWIPKLGGKVDGVPGHVNETWFKIPADKVGTVFSGQCAELCGTNHADMRAEVRAVSPEEYERWAERRSADIEEAGEALAEQREQREGEADELVATPEIVLDGLKPEPRGWLAWLTTTDHKKIGILYLFATFLFFILGGVEALIMRLQLAQPDNTLVQPETYNGLVTVHGTTMVFLFLVPVLAGFGNYLVPLMIGARDMAFPRLNALSFWLLLFGGVAFYCSIFFEPPQAGWTMYPPLSDDSFSPGGGVDAWIFMIHLTGISSLIGAVNFVATIHNMRAPGMSWGRMPLFVWTILVYSYLLIAALPAVAAAVTMLLTDRHFGTAFFDPAGGGDPMLWQHLFWFFGHPEVYIMVLPAFGMVSEILPVFARKPIFGYKAIAASTVAIAFLGLLVWAHHMFTTPTATVVLAFFMLASFTIAVPTGIKIFNWIATLWRGRIVFKTPLYFAAALPGLFVIGGISGVMLAIFPVDWQLHDTYFVVAHFHYVLFGGAVFGLFAGLYYWFPKMSGRMMSESLGKVSFWLMFVGFNLTFLVQHSAGLSGMPRRVYDYSEELGVSAYNLISTIGAFILAVGVLRQHGQHPALDQPRQARRQRPLAGQHARVVHDLAPAARTTSTRSRACAASSR